MSPASHVRHQRAWLFAWVALSAVTIATYRRVFDVFFLNEDFTWLWNCRLRTPHDLWQLVSHDVMGGKYSWRPLVQLAFGLTEAAAGVHTWLFRAEALLWHGLASGALLLIGRRLGGLAAGISAAALFALHPLQVESLAWTCAVGGPMAAACVMATLLAHLGWRDGRVGGVWIVLPFALALLAQESAVVALPMIVVADLLLPGTRPAWPRCVRLYALLVVVVVLAAVWRYLGSPADVGVPFASQLAIGVRERAVLAAGKLAAAASMSLTLPSAGWLVMVGMASVSVWRWRRGNGVALWGLIWAGLAIAPYVGFLLGPFPRYFPLVLAGLALTVAELAMALWRALPRRLRAAVAAAMLLLAAAWLQRMQQQIDAELQTYVQRGEQTEGFLREVRQLLPEVEPGSTVAFYRVGELRTRDGVFVFGLEEAIRLLYDDGSLHVIFPELGRGDGANYHLVYQDGRLWRLGGGA